MRQQVKIQGDKNSKLQQEQITNLCVSSWEASSKIKVLFSFLDDWHLQN